MGLWISLYPCVRFWEVSIGKENMMVNRKGLRIGVLAFGSIMTFLLSTAEVIAQAPRLAKKPDPRGYMVPAAVYGNDTIPVIPLRPIYCFAPMEFSDARQRVAYTRLIRDVKRTLPFAKIVASTMMETYEYMETLPDDKARSKHLKRMEKELYKEYKPELKKLTLTQGKLLLKLINRECGSSSYALIDAFLGGFSARVWNIFAGIFGASLQTTYDPSGEDALIERVCLMVEMGLV